MSRQKKTLPPSPRNSEGLFRAAVLLTAGAAVAVTVANVRATFTENPQGVSMGVRHPKGSERRASQRPTVPKQTVLAPNRRPHGETRPSRGREKVPVMPASPEAGWSQPSEAPRAGPSQPSDRFSRRGPVPAAAGPPPRPPADRGKARLPEGKAPAGGRETVPLPPVQPAEPSGPTAQARRAALDQVALPPHFTAEIGRGKPDLGGVANNEVARGNPKYPRVALTFDADGDSQPAAAILDVLRRQGVRATFFLTGRWAERNPDLVRRIHREGHELANHSYSHPHFPALSADDILEEVARTDRILRRLTGQAPRPYVRFPYGDRDVSSLRLLIREGYLAVYWSLDSHDWMEAVTGAEILERVIGKVQPGDILLFHATVAKTAKVLPQLLTELPKKGLTCGPVSSVLVP